MYYLALNENVRSRQKHFILGIFGLIGNALSILILSKPDMRNAFNQLLIALCTSDSVFTVVAIFDFAITR